MANIFVSDPAQTTNKTRGYLSYGSHYPITANGNVRDDFLMSLLVLVINEEGNLTDPGLGAMAVKCEGGKKHYSYSTSMAVFATEMHLLCYNSKSFSQEHN
eukprot:5361228-Ditylum_brightwellii.AAC.1